MVDAKALAKKVGRGILVTAASFVAGVALGPIGPAVGAFVAKKMAELGVSISPDSVSKMFEDRIGKSPMNIAMLTERESLENIAKAIAEETRVSQDEAFAAVQYGIRELRSALDGVLSSMREDRRLLHEVLNLTGENNTKIDELVNNSRLVESSLRRMQDSLEMMDARLEAVFREFAQLQLRGTRLGLEKLRVVSLLQRQSILLTSRYGVPYDPNLYVPRRREEAVFNAFLHDIGYSDKNCFLLLGDVGMGKTWSMARFSTMALDEGLLVFFVPLSHGVQTLTSLFNVQTISNLVSLLDEILSQEDGRTLIFLDGLDELSPADARLLLRQVSSSRSRYVSFVLSCRAADWAHSDSLVEASNHLRHLIYADDDATRRAHERGVQTPVSIFLSELTDDELKIAIQRYGLPTDGSIATEVLPMLRKPYFLRVVSDWFAEHHSVPQLDTPEFLILMAGTEDYQDCVFRRLGIVTHREALYKLVEYFIIQRRHRFPLANLPIEYDTEAFRALISSGLITLRQGTLGVEASLNPEFSLPLISLTLARLKAQGRRETVIESLRSWLPEIAESATRLADALLSYLGSSIDVPTEMAQEGTDRTTTLPQTAGESSMDSAEIQRPALVAVSQPARILSSIGGVPTELTNEVFEGIRTVLNDSDTATRASAALALALAGTALDEPREAFSLLLTCLTDGEIEVRFSAAIGLGLVATAMHDCEDAISSLSSLLKRIDDTWDIHQAVALGLGLAGTVASDPQELVSALNVAPWSEPGQKHIETACGHLLALAFVAPALVDVREVIEVLRSNVERGDAVVRDCGALGLGIVGMMLGHSQEVLDTLRRLLFDSEETVSVRQQAALGLALAGVLSDSPEDILVMALPFLSYDAEPSSGFLGPSHDELDDGSDEEDEIPDLPAPPGYNGAEETAQIREAVAEGLGLIATVLERAHDATNLLRHLLEDKSYHIRRGAAFGLALAGTVAKNQNQIVALLASLLENRQEDTTVRAQAALALAVLSTSLSEPDHIVTLLVNLLKEPYEHRLVRARAAFGLALIATATDKRREICDVLKSVAIEGSNPVRPDAIVALGLAASNIGQPWYEILNDSSDDDRSGHRVNAILASRAAVIGLALDEFRLRSYYPFWYYVGCYLCLARQIRPRFRTDG